MIGCGLSNIIIAWLACLAGAAYLAFGPHGARYRPFADWAAPDARRWRELLHLGLPMGLSNLVEITSFTLITAIAKWVWFEGDIAFGYDIKV